MLVDVLRANKRKLGRGAALLLISGMTAGCSSQMARFNSTDDIFTGSTDNQRQIINGSKPQAYPGDTVASAEPIHTGSINRSALPAPAAAQPYPVAPAAAAVAPAAPIATANPAPAVRVAERPEPSPAASAAKKPLLESVTSQPSARAADPAPFKASEPEAPSATASSVAPAGWTRAGGTQVVVKEGESVYSLSRRYGVPANVIAQFNGMPAGNGLKIGQKIVIPAAADASQIAAIAPKPVEAKAATIAKAERATEKLPTPKEAPKQTAVVLPKEPKAKDVAKADAVDGASKDKKTAAAEPKVASIVEPKPAQVEKAAEKKVVASGGYTVQSGDTLSRIAKKTGVSVASLKSANGIKDGALKIGQTLTVPAAGAQIAAAKSPSIVDTTITASTPPAKQAIAESSTAEAAPKKAEKVMEQAEASPEAAPDATGIGKMRWPVRGRVLSSYSKGGGKSNDGIDIAVPEGTAVKAAENGVVIYAGDGLKEFGNTVLVRHENGLVTVYGNASSLNVKRGEKVKRGQEIAVSGMSGNADTPKLHFEVRKNSAPVDPSTFLE